MSEPKRSRKKQKNECVNSVKLIKLQQPELEKLDSAGTV